MVPGRHHCGLRVEGEGGHLIGGGGQADVRAAAAAAFAGPNMRDRLLLARDFAVAQTDGGGGGARCHLSSVVAPGAATSI